MFNRTSERSHASWRRISARRSRPSVGERGRRARRRGLLVNTTSQGMIGQPPLEISLDALPSSALVSDIVYAPLETPLLAAARRQGLATVDGLGMLLHQARPAFRDWSGAMPEVTPALRALVAATL